MDERGDIKNDVFCVGSIILDIFFSPLVQKDKKGNFFLTNGVEIFIGGAAANSAFILKRIGSNPILSGLVGTDIFGRVLVERLEKYNLYNSNVRKFKGHTTTSFITLNDDSEPRFIQLEGVSNFLTPSNLDLNDVKKCKIIHIAGIFSLPGYDNGGVKSIIDFAKKNNIKTSADTSRNLSKPYLIKNYEGLDVLFSNYEEASSIAKTGDIKSIIGFFKTKTNFKITAIKMGQEGCVVISKKGHNFYNGFKIKPIDQCGAGDAFVAGFLHGLVNNWDEKKTAVFANACGAFNCLLKGATNDAFKIDGLLSKFNIGRDKE